MLCDVPSANVGEQEEAKLLTKSGRGKKSSVVHFRTWLYYHLLGDWGVLLTECLTWVWKKRKQNENANEQAHTCIIIVAEVLKQNQFVSVTRGVNLRCYQRGKQQRCQSICLTLSGLSSSTTTFSLPLCASHRDCLLLPFIVNFALFISRVLCFAFK